MHGVAFPAREHELPSETHIQYVTIPELLQDHEFNIPLLFQEHCRRPHTTNRAHSGEAIDSRKLSYRAVSIEIRNLATFRHNASIMGISPSRPSHSPKTPHPIIHAPTRISPPASSS